MKLADLIKDVKFEKQSGDLSAEISNIAFDSRKVQPGTLFVAIKGTKTDGHQYIAQAIKSGASAIIAQEDFQGDIPKIIVNNSRNALAQASANFFHHPAKKLKIIGVTGTNGKTTTTHMIAGILEAQGIPTGIIGTLYIKILDKTITARVTTPESLEIQEYLDMMVKAGVKAVVMEVSSHALYFDRVATIEFDGAIFTNLSQDHLDFHETLEEYFNEKKKLFRRIKPAVQGGFALLNGDDPRSGEILREIQIPCKTFGLHCKSDIEAINIQKDVRGTSFTAKIGEINIPIEMPMAGEFNIYNALGSIGAALFMNIPGEKIAAGLKNMPGVRGRFELINEGQPFGVVVDYAHTPDGLENVLSTAKNLVKHRLIAVFGCGGDRDRTKRPIMGKIGAQLADRVIITSDNPRTEDPMAIILDIEKGVKEVTNNYTAIVDRKSAIKKAIQTAEPGDIIVIAGKGHETYQIFKDETIHFDDAEVAREALRESKAKITP